MKKLFVLLVLAIASLNLYFASHSATDDKFWVSSLSMIKLASASNSEGSSGTVCNTNCLSYQVNLQACSNGCRTSAGTICLYGTEAGEYSCTSGTRGSCVTGGFAFTYSCNGTVVGSDMRRSGNCSSN